LRIAITQPSKRSKDDAFAEAPGAKPGGPKLRGKRQTITFGLPPELIAEIGRDERSATRGSPALGDQQNLGDGPQHGDAMLTLDGLRSMA
jgi:hypothetical protein